MKGRRSQGHTLIFPADTSGSACQTADARYAVSRTATSSIAGLGMDSCGGRHAGAGRNLEEVLAQAGTAG